MKGPAFSLTQCASGEATFNFFAGITRYMGNIGDRGVKIPTRDARLIAMCSA